jgi:mannose/cellobiose epimerase-like protein (N-acyl-D-glucosamine 2-epimerase family)
MWVRLGSGGEVIAETRLGDGGTAEAASELAYLNEASDEARLVVSEPLGKLEGAWNEVPEATWGIVRPNGDDEMHPSHPAEAARLL